MKNNSGLLHLLAVVILIIAATYAWPDILRAIEKGSFEGAKAGAEAATEKAIEKAKAEMLEAIKDALPWR